MNILITNDDGYQAEGLKKLVKHCLAYGNIIVVAPKEEQSGKSCSCIFKTSYQVYPVEDIVPGVKTWVVESTPTDCVRIARYYLNLDFDIVLSGINKGFNLGDDINYSGTIGAATEAILCGKKAIALSTDYDSFEGIDINAQKIIDEIINNKLLEKWNFYNINIPSVQADIIYTHQGKVHYDSIYYQKEDGTVMAKSIIAMSKLLHDHSDIDYVHHDYITITPMNTDRTNYEILKLLNDLKK